MQAHHLHPSSLGDLKEHVYQVLCQYEKLEHGVFPMTETVLKRRRQPCGIYFCLHGPRSVKFTAIWDSDRNTLLFYGATGERFLKLELASGPVIQTQIA